MSLEELFPIWNQLTERQQEMLQNAVMERHVKRGTVLHNGSEDCVGLFLVQKGQLRAYILSDEGKEITLYRLFVRDICLFSASCMLSSIQFDICVEVVEDTKILVIPTSVYRELMQTSIAVSNYTNQLMASRFSDVMWLMDQILYKSFASRLAAFLVEECSIRGSNSISITHERIASHLGTAREVVTRMLKYFQSEGMVVLSRGEIQVENREKLEQLAEDNFRSM